MLELEAQMRMKPQNVIVLQFKKRLRQYVRFRYETSFTEINSLVKSSCCKKGAFTPEETKLRERLGMLPNEIQLKQNLTHLLTKLRNLLVWMDECQHETGQERRSGVLYPAARQNGCCSAHQDQRQHSSRHLRENLSAAMHKCSCHPSSKAR